MPDNRLFDAAKALVDNVKARYPGEDLHCPYMRELEAALSAQDGAVGVKALQWKSVGDYIGHAEKAETIVGTYLAQSHGAYFDNQLFAATSSIDDAKAASKTHYEARIRSALSPSPAQEEDRGGTWSDDGKVYVGPAQEAGAEPVKVAIVDHGKTSLAPAITRSSPPLDRGGEWEQIEAAHKKWKAQRGGIGFACFNSGYEQERAFAKADADFAKAVDAAIRAVLASSPSPEGK